MEPFAMFSCPHEVSTYVNSDARKQEQLRTSYVAFACARRRVSTTISSTVSFRQADSAQMACLAQN